MVAVSYTHLDVYKRQAQEAEIAEAAGAVAVMALERVPSDIRRDGVRQSLVELLIKEESILMVLLELINLIQQI